VHTRSLWHAEERKALGGVLGGSKSDWARPSLWANSVSRVGERQPELADTEQGRPFVEIRMRPPLWGLAARRAPLPLPNRFPL
jgi:hypothetical protein